MEGPAAAASGSTGAPSEISFGLGMVTAQRRVDDVRSAATIYAELLEICRHAEDCGFDSVWLSEHHFVDDGYMPSLLPTAAAVAARTTTIRIATGVLVAPLYDPLRLAEDAATVDLISQGRLVLGLGAGYRVEEFDGMGRSNEHLGAVLDQTLRVLREAWSGEPVTSTGTPVRVTPQPMLPAGPPIWLGARSPAGIRRAGRWAQGLLAARVDPDAFATQVARFTAAAEAAGRSRDDLAVGVHCPVLTTRGEDAWSVLEPHLYYSEWKYKDMMGVPYGKRNGPNVAPALSDHTRDVLRGSVGQFVGEPDDVARGIAAYVAGAGGLRFEFIPRLYWPGMPLERQLAVITDFAELVMPRVRQQLASPRPA